MRLTPTNDKTEQRANRLRDLIDGDGITPLTVLDPEFRRLFALTTNDPDAFVKVLVIEQGILPKTPEIQAAYFALGIDTMELGDLEQRRDIQLKKRHGQHWDVHDHGNLLVDERRGFIAIAEQYDQAMALKVTHDRHMELVTLVRNFAANEKLTLRQQVLLNHAADKADPDGAGPKL